MIAVRRAEQLLGSQITPSLSREILRGIDTDDGAVDALTRVVERNAERLRQIDVKLTVQCEFIRIDDALSSRTVNTLLRLFPGKELVQQVCDLLHIAVGSDALLDYYRRHFPVADIPYFREIQGELRRLFPPPAT